MKRIAVALYLGWSLASVAYAQPRGATGAVPVASERRVALVIGNASYPSNALANPVNDARDIAGALTDLGFKVTLAENLGYKEMKRAIQEFGDQIRDGGVALFYFAGHGIQVAGENYLIPVDGTIRREEEVEYEAVNVGWLLAQMKGAHNRLNIVILDACRNNPLARSSRGSTQGLASINAPSGTLIAYSTAPGSVARDGRGRNSPYAEALVSYMRAGGLKIEDVFKAVRNHVEEQTKAEQTPWESSSLKGDFCFGPCDAAKTESGGLAADGERIFWEAIESSRDPQGFRNYLGRYPNGRHRNDAEARLRQLEQPSRQLEHTDTPASGAATQETGGWKLIEDQRARLAANLAWSATGLKAEARQQIVINVSGPQVSLGAYGYSGPEGVGQTDGARPLRDCPTGAVIARIGSDLICIQAQATFVAPSGGELFLGLNESRVADNSGAFVARIRVYQRGR